MGFYLFFCRANFVGKILKMYRKWDVKVLKYQTVICTYDMLIDWGK